jgi:hypothetical protein
MKEVWCGFCDFEAEPDKFLGFIAIEIWQEKAASHSGANRGIDIEFEHVFKNGLSGQNEDGGGCPGLGVVEEGAEIDEGLFVHGMGIIHDEDGKGFIGFGVEVFLESREKVFSSGEIDTESLAEFAEDGGGFKSTIGDGGDAVGFGIEFLGDGFEEHGLSRAGLAVDGETLSLADKCDGAG